MELGAALQLRHPAPDPALPLECSSLLALWFVRIAKSFVECCVVFKVHIWWSSIILCVFIVGCFWDLLLLFLFLIRYFACLGSLRSLGDLIGDVHRRLWRFCWSKEINTLISWSFSSILIGRRLFDIPAILVLGTTQRANFLFSLLIFHDRCITIGTHQPRHTPSLDH